MGDRGILNHELWSELKPHFRLGYYRRDRSEKRGPRFRIEMKKGTPAELLAKAIEIEIECVSCGRAIRPIRCSDGRPGYFYFACTCGKDARSHFKCRNSSAASKEYKKIQADLEGSEAPKAEPRQGELF